MQNDPLHLFRVLAPEMMENAALRCLVLERICSRGPIGRRQLASMLGQTERDMRTVAEKLREEGLIELGAAGMTATEKGKALMPYIVAFQRAENGLDGLEQQLTELFGVPHVVIIPGDADADEKVLEEVAKAAAQQLRTLLHRGDTIAVTGGKMMSLLARELHTVQPMHVMVVPARGGIGAAVETQANAVAEEFASRLGGHYRLLHLPDHMDRGALQEILEHLPEEKETVELVRRAGVTVHSVELAERAARYYGMPQSTIRTLLAEGAVAETLGCFMNARGEKIHNVSYITEGKKQKTKMVLAAAGSERARAIAAALKSEPHLLLVTDEGAARCIVAGI